jgi:hypothetical protein
LSAPGNDTPLVLSVTYAKPRAEIVGGMAALMRGA